MRAQRPQAYAHSCTFIPTQRLHLFYIYVLHNNALLWSKSRTQGLLTFYESRLTCNTVIRYTFKTSEFRIIIQEIAYSGRGLFGQNPPKDGNRKYRNPHIFVSLLTKPEMSNPEVKRKFYSDNKQNEAENLGILRSVFDYGRKSCRIITDSGQWQVCRLRTSR